MMNITRREALKLGLVGTAGLFLGTHGKNVLADSTVSLGNAKSVIQIWMWGGPSQIDTFDPKPNAGYNYCGPFDETIPTNVDGIQINAMLPLLAQQADKYSIIRSMTHGVNGHETASYITQTGRWPSRLVYPGVGAVVSTFKGYDAGYDGIVSPYVTLTRVQGRFSEAGFLGHSFKPFATGGNPNAQRFEVEGIVAPGITDKRQESRRGLLSSLDTLGNAMSDSSHFMEHNSAENEAYDLILGDAKELFNLSNEDDDVREAYGRNTFGQSCLMARRLVEADVPYVTINYGGWDTHKRHFPIMNQKLPEMDAAMAMLFQDLSDRGLLDTTIVWWTGEFGRGPKVDWQPPWNGGRSHWGACFSTLLAGGGFHGGRVVGASDDKAMYVAERPVYPVDLIGSIYNRIGIDPKGQLPNSRGIEASVLPFGEEGVKSEGLLTEIM